MKQYLISFYQPDGPPPPPEFLAPIMREMGIIKRELEAAGSWVFAGGLHPPSTATLLRAQGAEVIVTEINAVVADTVVNAAGKRSIGVFHCMRTSRRSSSTTSSSTLSGRN